MSKEFLRILAAFTLVLITGTSLTAQYGYYYFGRNKIQYQDFEWQVLETEHFNIYYYASMEDLAKIGAGFAEEAYAELENRFEVSLNRRVPLVFYASNLHFKQTNVTPGFIPDNVGGFFEFLKGRVVVPSNGDIQRFRRVIRHELVHVFTYAKVIRTLKDHRKPLDRFLPLWFTEGLAEYWSGEADEQHEMLIRDAVASNYMVPMNNLYSISGTYQMYKEGEAICRFISERYGEDKILALIENVWKDRDFRKLLEITLREEFRTISAAWDEWMAAQYYPRLGQADLPSLLADGVTVRGYNAKPAYYRKADGTRVVYFVGNKSGYGNLYAARVDSTFRPLERPRELVKGERSSLFEAFHLFDSRIDVNRNGLLAFVTKSGERDVIHVYDVEGDQLLDTYAFASLVAVYSPNWNRDGTKLAFTSIDERGFSDLYTYELSTKTLRRLTNDEFDDREAAWSPDGTELVFSSDRTGLGKSGAYNLFTIDVDSRHIRYVTYGDRRDFSPRWSPDGSHVIFASVTRDSSGVYGGRNVWLADMRDRDEPGEPLASVGLLAGSKRGTTPKMRLHRLTNFASAVFDPVWTSNGDLLFSSYEHSRFAIRRMPDVDSMLTAPKETEVVDLGRVTEGWEYEGLSEEENTRTRPYKRRYSLDIAQAGVQQNPIWGSSGGAFIALSDMLGDDFWFFSLYNGARTQGDFLRSLSFSVTRLQLHRRTNTAYGIFRHGGLRYDITDPDAAVAYPIFWETIYGGFGSVSYPISQFRRVEVATSLNWSNKAVTFKDIQRKALLLSNQLSLVHDNALYGRNGPVAGWRGNVTLAYTTDVLYSNVSYFTLTADLRHYWRISRNVTFASWGMVRANQGKEARLHILGGSWDLRGYRLFGMRGRKLWFTSQELRFPIVDSPGRYVPLLGIVGITNLRGALFLDVAHAWNDTYSNPDPRLLTGETLGSAGFGFRMNLFGGLVLRYDLGYRHRNGFKTWEPRLFKQFFFGWDF